MNRKVGWARRCASLRQTRSPQISLELQVSQPAVIFATVPTTSTPKKSNWEVIEHYNTGSKGRGSVSSSLIAVC